MICMFLTQNFPTIIETGEMLETSKKGMSYQHMAKLLCVSTNRIYQWEKAALFEKIQVRSL